MPNVVITPDLVELTKIGLREVFLNEFNAPGTIWNTVFPESESTKSLEEELIMAGFGSVPEWNSDNGAISYDSPLSGDRILFTHTDYALGWVLSHKMLREDLYKKTGKDLTSAAALSVRHTVEQICANVFNNAFTTNGPDGKPLIDDAHPMLDGSTQDNKVSSALTADTLKSAIGAFRRLKNHRGQPILIEPTTLIVPPELEYTAKELINNTWSNASNVHSENVLKGVVNRIIVWPYLTDTNNWFLTANPNQTKLRFFWREKPSYDMDNVDFNTKSVANSVNFAFSVGYTSWEGIYGSNPV